MTKKGRTAAGGKVAGPARDLPTFPASDDGTVHIEAEGDMLRRLFGTRTPEAALGLTSTAMNALGPTADLRPFMTAMLAEAEPGDALEAMLVVQMTATHVAMTRAARLSADAKTSAMHEAFERCMTRLSRTYLAQLDALKRYRAKAQQTVRVEHVNVYGGGQAIVGDVAHGGERRAT